MKDYLAGFGFGLLISWVMYAALTVPAQKSNPNQKPIVNIIQSPAQFEHVGPIDEESQ